MPGATRRFCHIRSTKTVTCCCSVASLALREPMPWSAFSPADVVLPCGQSWYSIVAMARGVVELEPEVEKWLESLPTTQFAHAAFYVDLLAEQGPLLGEPYTKQLDRKLRELRFHFERRAVRIT
jgi:hypothetical protein